MTRSRGQAPDSDEAGDRDQGAEANPGQRLERDGLGEVSVPAGAYFGAQTQRALAFEVAGLPLGRFPTLVRGIAQVKKAAAAANRDLGALEPSVAEAIIDTCDEILAGRMHEQFAVDVLVPTDTSYNMNANEVIANRATERLGGALGTYSPVHPNDHVNLSQSTNDAIHTALHLASREILQGVDEQLAILESSFRDKSAQTADVIKMGRTCMQDALPITLGQVLGGYAASVGQSRLAVSREADALAAVNLGATAIGTGFGAPDGYAEAAISYLGEFTGEVWIQAPDLVAATQNQEALSSVAARLRLVAVSLSKMATDDARQGESSRDDARQSGRAPGGRLRHRGLDGHGGGRARTEPERLSDLLLHPRIGAPARARRTHLCAPLC